MKKFTFKGVLDGFRSSNQQPGGGIPAGAVGQTRPDLTEIPENLRAEHFNVTKTFTHGFPYQPQCMAYDPIQRLLAIGTKSGALRILGRPGVDIHAKHEPEFGAVHHLQFVWNEGIIISSTADDSIHLWNFRLAKKPEIVHSLKFQRERITCLYLPFQSKWVYVGTERGNIHVVNSETLQLSGYVINWNKAIELCRKTHPGSVIYLGDNPTDTNELLIGFDSGQLVIWDLKCKAAELRYQTSEPLKSVSWHSDGKQFICSHTDGSLTTWNTRIPNNKPVGLTFPHSRSNKDGKPELCKPILQVEWKSSRTGENFVIFSGGLTADRAGKTPSLTVIHGKTTTVLEVQDPYAIVVLLQQDLVVIDLLTPGYPCFENPYSMDVHESPVTCCTYIADCPGDLIPAFYLVGSKAVKKTGFSDREWPINGGTWGSSSCSYAEIIITGHADGSVKFWDATSTSLQVLYKLKTSKPFERPKNRRSTESSSADDDPFAVQYLALCPDSRLLAVAGSSCQVLVYKYKKTEATYETSVLEIPIVYEVEDGIDYYTSSGGFDFAKTCDLTKPSVDYFVPIRVKTGPQKRLPGYQAEVVCLTPWVNGEPPGAITALAVNSSYGLLSYGNESGIVIVDIVQKTCLLNMGTPDLYGTSDPYQRAPKSPKRPEIYDEKSPTGDQVSDLASHKSDELDTTNNTPTATSITSAPTGILIEETGNEDSMDFLCAPKSTIMSGSMSKLPSSTDVEGNDIPKCRSTTPPATTDKARTKSYTWSQMKGLILGKKAAEFQALAKEQNKEKESNNSLTINTNDTNTHLLPSPCLSDQIGESQNTSAAGSVSSDDSPSPPLPRPDNLNFVPVQQPPAPPARVKKKKSLLNFSSTTSGSKKSSVASVSSTAWVDLRSSGDVKDATHSTTTSGGGSNSFFKKIHKLDNTFSRSRSSSMSSMDNITSEAIQCLVFIDSFCRKGDLSQWPALWVGTSLGSVLVISISLPNGIEARKTEPVMVTPSGTIFRLKGAILAMNFLDFNGSLLTPSFEGWRDESKEQKTKTPTKVTSMGSRQSPSQLSLDSGNGGGIDRQFTILVSEKQSRVVTLPSQTCLYKQQLCETSFVVKAEVTTVKDSPCLVCYVSTGHLQIYSLPSLRQLVDVDFVPLSDFSFHQTRKSGILLDPMLAIWGQQMFVNEDCWRIAKTFYLSNFGHGMFLSSPCEMQKFSISTEFCQGMDSMLGDLYLECEMPEKPKESFLTGLFGGGVRNLDREELFGEASGKCPRSVAKLIPGPAMTPEQRQMEHLNMRAGTVAGEVSRTRMLMVERGEKLGQLEDKSAKLMSEAENFSSAAHQLMLKYKDKKWYQL